MAKLQPPPLTGNDNFDRWLRLFVPQALAAPDVTESTSDHALLQNLNSADYAHVTIAQAQSLTSNGNNALHYHDSDRNRANHTGTQTSATISDFAATVQANSNNNAGFYLSFSAAYG
jgi:hypothetical protein